MEIYDGHCHVASTDFIPEQFLWDVAANMHCRLTAEGIAPPIERLVARVRSQHQDHDADQLVREMDAAGVRRSVLLCPDFSERMDCPHPPAEMARRHHEIRLRHPGRFWVFMGADPRQGAEGLDRFEKGVHEYGFEGLKLYPPCGYSPSDPRLYPYYEICASRHLPVFLHTGPTAGSLDFEFAHPLQADRPARDFPTVSFILGHGGVTHTEIALSMAAYRPNVYLDIGGFAGAPVTGGWPEHLNRLFRSGVNDKIVFGTDWPLNRMSGGLRRLLAEFADGSQVFAGVRKRERQLILGENLLRLLAEG